MATEPLEFEATSSETLTEMEEAHYHRRQAGWYLLDAHVDTLKLKQDWPYICLWVRRPPPPIYRYKCYRCESFWSAPGEAARPSCPVCLLSDRIAILGASK